MFNPPRLCFLDLNQFICVFPVKRIIAAFMEKRHIVETVLHTFGLQMFYRERAGEVSTACHLHK